MDNKSTRGLMQICIFVIAAFSFYTVVSFMTSQRPMDSIKTLYNFYQIFLYCGMAFCFWLATRLPHREAVARAGLYATPIMLLINVLLITSMSMTSSPPISFMKLLMVLNMALIFMLYYSLMGFVPEKNGAKGMREISTIALLFSILCTLYMILSETRDPEFIGKLVVAGFVFTGCGTIITVMLGIMPEKEEWHKNETGEKNSEL